MSKKSKKESFFWTSYSDLMTSMFFVMLVLFILSIVFLKSRQRGIEIALENYKRIVQIDKQFNILKNDPDFIFLEACNKYVASKLTNKPLFKPNQSKIELQYISDALLVGKKIRDFISQLGNNNKFSYLLVIEGNTANTWNMKFNKDNDLGYKLSYNRALALYQLWQKHGLDFRKFKNVEVLIAGSGFSGLCRDETAEENNKRFSIQIIPKVNPDFTELTNEK